MLACNRFRLVFQFQFPATNCFLSKVQYIIQHPPFRFPALTFDTLKSGKKWEKRATERLYPRTLTRDQFYSIYLIIDNTYDNPDNGL